MVETKITQTSSNDVSDISSVKSNRSTSSFSIARSRKSLRSVFSKESRSEKKERKNRKKEAKNQSASLPASTAKTNVARNKVERAASVPNKILPPKKELMTSILISDETSDDVSTIAFSTAGAASIAGIDMIPEGKEHVNATGQTSVVMEDLDVTSEKSRKSAEFIAKKKESIVSNGGVKTSRRNVAVAATYDTNATGNGSVAYDDNYSTHSTATIAPSVEIFMLLVNITEHTFKLLQLEFETKSASLSCILEQVHVCIKDTPQPQEYVGVCNSKGLEMGREMLLGDFKQGTYEVMVAIPKGKTVMECMNFAGMILQDENVGMMLKAVPRQRDPPLPHYTPKVKNGGPPLERKSSSSEQITNTTLDGSSTAAYSLNTNEMADSKPSRERELPSSAQITNPTLDGITRASSPSANETTNSRPPLEKKLSSIRNIADPTSNDTVASNAGTTTDRQILTLDDKQPTASNSSIRRTIMKTVAIFAVIYIGLRSILSNEFSVILSDAPQYPTGGVKTPIQDTSLILSDAPQYPTGDVNTPIQDTSQDINDSVGNDPIQNEL